MAKNHVKPTRRQLATFENLKHTRSLREAMMRAGYSEKTSSHPRQKLVESEGFQILLVQHREELHRAGVSTKLLAEILMAGLFDKNAMVRLNYSKRRR